MQSAFTYDEIGREPGLRGMSARYTDEGFTLYRSTHNQLLMQTDDGYFYLFEDNPHAASHFRLCQQLDRHQNRLTWHYDPQGQLQQISDDMQQLQVIFSYDPRLQRLIQVRQVIPHQHPRVGKILVQYEYNDAAELIQVRDADGVITRQYGYDPRHHLMTHHRYATGLTAHYRYRHFAGDAGEDAHYRVVEHRLQDGDVVLEKMHLRYDLAHQQVEVTEEGKGSSYRRWGRTIWSAILSMSCTTPGSLPGLRRTN